MDNNASPGTFNWPQIAVLLGGLLVFVLLVFANKSNLNDDTADEVGNNSGQPTEKPQGKKSLLTFIPPLELSSGLSDTIASLDTAKTKVQRELLLRGLVDGLMKAGRYDGAAVFAAQLAEEQPETRNLLVAGALLRNACELPQVLNDTNVFRRFMDRSIECLEQAETKESENVDVLLELGLAYVGSQKPGLGMQGILKIRRVLEFDPNNEEAEFHLGRFSIDTGQFEKAKSRLERVLELNPSNIKAKYFLAIAYKNLGKSQDFKKLMTEVAQSQDVELAKMATQILND